MVQTQWSTITFVFHSIYSQCQAEYGIVFQRNSYANFKNASDFCLETHCWIGGLRHVRRPIRLKTYRFVHGIFVWPLVDQKACNHAFARQTSRGADEHSPRLSTWPLFSPRVRLNIHYRPWHACTVRTHVRCTAVGSYPITVTR